MAFDWTRFLEFAEELVVRDPQDVRAESSWRSGTSRAYYAAFHAVRDYVRDCEPVFSLPRGDAHQALIEYVKRIHVHSGLHIRVANSLRVLRDARNSADYEPTPGHTQANARQFVKDAGSILGIVAELRRRRGAP